MLKTTIISLSAAGLGLVAYLAVLNVRAAIRVTGWERRINAAYAVARVGFFLVVSLITEAVFDAPTLPVTWRAALYVVGLVFVAFGYLGVAVEQRASRRER
jgi:amino acid transporter